MACQIASYGPDFASSGPVRGFRWCDDRREEQYLEQEVNAPNRVQLSSGPQLAWGKSGFHGEMVPDPDFPGDWLLRMFRHRGADAEWHHSLLTFRRTDMTPGLPWRWRCIQHPVTLVAIERPTPAPMESTKRLRS